MLEELSDDEVERQATEFYEHDLRATLEATHPNAFVAIEPVSRTYYIGNTLSERPHPRDCRNRRDFCTTPHP